VKADDRPLVLHAIHHLVVGGMENGLVNLINNMPPSRYRHAIACIEGYSSFRDRISRPDVEVVALQRSRIGIWRLREEILRLCRRLQPTILHSRNLSGLDALLPARLAGVRHTVHGEHGWDVDNINGRKWKPALLRRLHSPLVDRYVTVSKDLERFLVERIGIAAARITQIYNGVDTNRFSPSPSKPLGWLPPGFQRDDLILIGTVGRIEPVKDHATLLRAFSSLVTDRSDLRNRLRLVVVGDGPLLTDLRALAASLGIDSLTWFPGALDTVPDVLRSLDIFVLPSLNEGISNTILEAMATGVPIVASEVGGNVELLVEGTSGRFFPAGDIGGLARLLGEFATDTSKSRGYGRSARQMAVERYSLLAMVAGYEAVYDLVRRKDAPPTSQR
jgi:sugar transferase (PEP-CTERM/EpsH1 system associated)